MTVAATGTRHTKVPSLPPVWFLTSIVGGFPIWWAWTYYLKYAVEAYQLGAVPFIEQGLMVGEGEL